MTGPSRVRGLAALWIAAALCGCSCSDEQPAPNPRAQQASIADPMASDERLALLLSPSPVRHGFYDVDLSDPSAVLVEILTNGQHDPLKRAKVELGAMGDAGVVAVRRMVERYRNDPAGIDYLRNAIDALSLGESQASYDLLASLLDHPLESLRMQTLRGLKRRGRPAEYERVHRMMLTASDPFVGEIALTLPRFDAERARLLYLDWIETGEMQPLWDSVLPVVAAGGAADSESPEIVERCRKLIASKLDPHYSTWLEGPLVRVGDADATARLRTRLSDPNPTIRDIALRTLAGAGRFEELRKPLLEDPWPGVRLVAAASLAHAPDGELTRSLLAQGGNDEDPTVRQTCLEALAKLGEPAAIDIGLGLLAKGSPMDLDQGTRILAQRWDADPEVARRAFEKLRELFEAQSDRTLNERAELIKCLGRLPLREGTEFLYAVAVGSKSESTRGRDQRWILLQSANGGAPAQAVLAEHLRASRDPLLRMDLLEALSAPGGEHARKTLLEVVSEPSTSAYELLYSADRLARIGPVSEVAWQLKRAYLQRAWTPEEQPVRQAFTDLLWLWFPGPR